MSTDTKSKPAYMLLFRGNDWARSLSPEQMQQVMNQWRAWFEGLVAQGIAKSGHPLEPEGKIVSGRKGRVTVADGPFAESKEAIGGYFYLEVNTLDQAVAIAKQCPGLEHGAVVEVRPVAEQCTLVRAAMAEGRLAHAAA